MSEAGPPRITGIHHSAYRCRDAAETRAFYEGVLGLEVAAALAFDTNTKGPYGNFRIEPLALRRRAF